MGALSTTACCPLPTPCRYRKWRLNEAGEVDIIVRCEVDGVLPGKGDGDVQLLSIKALNETDMRAQVSGAAVVACLVVLVLYI
jgi:hypothetical protein